MVFFFFFFQFLIVMSICTNCTLLVCLYDQEGKWKIEPGLAAILIIEHVLLLVKFGFSHFVPEVGRRLETLNALLLPKNHFFFPFPEQEPAWVRVNREKNVAQAQDLCSKQLLSSISSLKARKAD